MGIVRGARSLWTAASLAPLLTALLVSSTAAQEVVRPVLNGRVIRGDDSVGVPAIRVQLHMVTPDTATELDSVQAGPGGEFSFNLPTVPDPLGRGEVYFASVNYQGVLYVGPTVHQPDLLDSLNLLVVHDTTMAPEGGVELPLSLRYMILQPDVQGWVVTDVMQVENSGSRTFVAREGETVWRYPLPEGASDMVPGGGLDAPPESMRLIDGQLEIAAPMAPGMRQYMVQYRLPNSRLDTELPGTVRQFELLIREPAPLLSVTGLTLNEPAEMEPGVFYRRYSAVDVQDLRVLVMPGVARRGVPLQWLAVMMGLTLAVVTLWAMQRGDLTPAVEGAEHGWFTAREKREGLLLELAQLEERLEGAPAGERGALTSRRRALLQEIRGLG